MKNGRFWAGVSLGPVIGLFFVFLLGLPHSGICAWQTLTGYAGWEVDYNFVYNGYTTDLYRYNGTNRFWYNQGPGQWFDRSAVSGAWSVLGPAGQSRTFMGDHNWHAFTDNKSFQLHTNNEWGVWRDNGVERFLYDYTRGQWCDHSAVNGTWSCLGPDKQLSAFIGDHKWRTFTDNRSYQYYTNNQWGVWMENGQYRFLYDYAAGQWKDRSVGNGTWSNLGPTNQLSAYIGDHSWRDFGNGITYRFYDNNAWGTFQQNGTYRFLYDYSTGQWNNRSTAVGTWVALGAPGQLSAWICDSAWHTMDSIWSYQLTSSGIGYLRGSVSTWIPTQTGGGSWSTSPTQFTCNYGYQVFGLYDSSSTSSVFLYDYNGGSAYSIKWTDWNYNISNKSEISAATVFYTGSTARDVSSWLSWLGITPNPGCITRTETWDFRNNDLANRYNHEVRAFGNSMWLVQRAQGSIGNCGIIASIDSYEAKSGLYVGYTRYWQDTAYAKGWCDSTGSTTSSQQANLMKYMGSAFNWSVNTYSGTTANRTLSDLLSLVRGGGKVILGIELSKVPEFASSGGHAVALVGDTYIGGVHYAQITNGWSIQTNPTNPTQITGSDPRQAYPITNIPWSELQNAYFSYARIE